MVLLLHEVLVVSSPKHEVLVVVPSMEGTREVEGVVDK
jgi:hypothetical protein